MARKRFIDPGYFMNDDIAECSLEARYMGIALLGIVDRNGAIDDRPLRIKAATMPYDNLDARACVAELVRAGFMTRYDVDGKAYLHITKFTKYQSPHHKETARYPLTAQLQTMLRALSPGHDLGLNPGQCLSESESESESVNESVSESVSDAGEESREHSTNGAEQEPERKPERPKTKSQPCTGYHGKVSPRCRKFKGEIPGDGGNYFAACKVCMSYAPVPHSKGHETVGPVVKKLLAGVLNTSPAPPSDPTAEQEAAENDRRKETQALIASRGITPEDIEGATNG